MNQKKLAATPPLEKTATQNLFNYTHFLRKLQGLRFIVWLARIILTSRIIYAENISLQEKHESNETNETNETEPLTHCFCVASQFRFLFQLFRFTATGGRFHD